MFRYNLTNYLPRWLLTIAIIFFILVLIFLIIYITFEKVYENKIYPGIFLGKYDLGGKTGEQAQQLLNQQINNLNQSGISFTYKNQSTVIYPVIASLESDLAYQVINFNVEQTLTEAIDFGRTDNFLFNLGSKIETLLFKKQLNLSTAINLEQINKILKDSFNKFEQPALDAKLIVNQHKSSPNYEFSVTEEVIGKVINYDRALANLAEQLNSFDFSPISLATKTDYPVIYKRDCLNIESKALAILNLAPIILKYEEKSWTINGAKLTDWLTLKDNSANTNGLEDKILVSLDQGKVSDFLNTIVAPEINLEPLDAKFSISAGRVNEFQASRNGRLLDLAVTINQLEEKIKNLSDNEIALVVKNAPSIIKTENINNFGVREIIGTGQSNFAGSPVNRRHNIKVGADSLHGLLIKPSEEFSLIKALGEINSSTGYLPELVIKENKTTPEFGGGLCQIGTTMFRTALASGLPITMRQNHSYRVVYYEPAGTDATIYDPWPDFRFINDTSQYILIQSRIEGDNLFFDFWGTSDGRIATQTKPVIYNITKPEPAKLIETLDLKPGVKKCTEKTHNGADTYFDYKVTYPNGEIKQKRFSSHYVPWREVCLIGVEKLSTDSASSTPAITTPSLTP